MRIAPGRTERPTDLDTGPFKKGAKSVPIERCPFCRGAEADTPHEIDRIESTPGEWSVRVVPNKYAAFALPDGTHEVVIESPKHIAKFADLSAEQAASAIRMWGRRVRHWRTEALMDYLLLFKNEGKSAGASLEHLHSQFVALTQTPPHVMDMWEKLGDGTSEKRQSITPSPARLIHTTDKLALFSPVAPGTAFETWIAPVDPTVSFEEFSASEAGSHAIATLLQQAMPLASEAAQAGGTNLVLQIPPNRLATKQLGKQLENLWWIEIVPRSSSLAGFEWATNWLINPVAPEVAAAQLRHKLNLPTLS